MKEGGPGRGKNCFNTHKPARILLGVIAEPKYGSEFYFRGWMLPKQ